MKVMAKWMKVNGQLCNLLWDEFYVDGQVCLFIAIVSNMGDMFNVVNQYMSKTWFGTIN